MITKQRMENDIATMGRREIADNTKKDNRDRNDGLTAERRFKADRGKVANKIMRNSRDRNDELTIEKRDKTDRTIMDNRLRNDEITINRRETKDGNIDMALAISLLILVAVVVGIFLI